MIPAGPVLRYKPVFVEPFVTDGALERNGEGVIDTGVGPIVRVLAERYQRAYLLARENLGQAAVVYSEIPVFRDCSLSDPTGVLGPGEIIILPFNPGTCSGNNFPISHNVQKIVGDQETDKQEFISVGYVPYEFVTTGSLFFWQDSPEMLGGYQYLDIYRF